MLMLLLAPVVSAATPAFVAVRAGPSAFYLLPGVDVAAERALGDHAIGSVSVFGETIGVAGRFGAAIGVDAVSRADHTGWYAGGRVAGWGLVERAGPTAGTSVKLTAGRRFGLGDAVHLRLGLGAALPWTIAGDGSLGRRLQPGLDLDVARVLR